MSEETVVVCQGCENECEVVVAVGEGRAVCLGGNKCPTGEIYALAQVEKGQREPFVVRSLGGPTRG